ncbi:MAG: universal stress protein [Leptolyngbya sp. SIO4C5]|uniref:universal stress protein n=1 Tax=Sphaerothrix gracilis TaxID=3151835 RepID=UPI0013BF8CE3|nr:universal stress protein [Leptolyngbya sp. SIO4C5]
MMQRILVAVDNSEHSQSVADEAIALAKALKAQLHFFHVLLPLDGGYPNPLYITNDGMHSMLATESFQNYVNQWQVAKEQGENLLNWYSQSARSEGLTVMCSQAVGDPSRAICNTAQQWRADLIMMGRRGRSGLSELLLGSVSNYVMHHADCSVLTVQGKAVETVEQPEMAAVSS